MVYVICGKSCEIQGLRKEFKIFTQSLGRLVFIFVLYTMRFI